MVWKYVVFSQDKIMLLRFWIAVMVGLAEVMDEECKHLSNQLLFAMLLQTWLPLMSLTDWVGELWCFQFSSDCYLCQLINWISWKMSNYWQWMAMAGKEQTFILVMLEIERGGYFQHSFLLKFYLAIYLQCICWVD
jgi:hypothetical protein